MRQSTDIFSTWKWTDSFGLSKFPTRLRIFSSFFFYFSIKRFIRDIGIFNSVKNNVIFPKILRKVSQINATLWCKVFLRCVCLSCSTENRNNSMLNISAAALKVISSSKSHLYSHHLRGCWMEHPFKNPKECHWDNLDLAPNMKLYQNFMLLVRVENQILSRYDKRKLTVSITKWIDWYVINSLFHQIDSLII